MRKEVGYFIKDISDKKKKELSNDEIIKVAKELNLYEKIYS